MDENSYRRVMSRNLDEFGLNQGNKSPNNNTNQSNDFVSSSSSPYTTSYSTAYGTTTNRSGYGTSSTHNTNTNTYNTSSNQNYYNRSMSNDYSSDYGRKKNNINLKQIKAVGLSCAKNLTNKLINLSNTVAGTSSSNTNRTYGTQNIYSSSSSNNKYSCSSKEVYVINSGNNNNYQSNTNTNYGVSTSGYSSGTSGYGTSSYPQSHPNYGASTNTSVVDSRVYTLKCIADRIATTDDLIKTHRELVAVIERCLTHSEFLVEITIEKDRFGAPTMDSINKFTLINKVLVEKILTYIKGRRDCCIFVVKFATWRMRTTKKPEEVILSLELLQKCMNDMGGYFLSLFTKSLMKTLRKLLFATNLKHSITSGVKKKITKFLGKTNYVHPGVSTDIRIHIFKSKIMYMVQLYYEVFLFEQGEYVVFYDGYKDMRIRGIKFPSINPEDKNQINKSYTFSSFNSANSGSASSQQYGSSRHSHTSYSGNTTPTGYRILSINLGSPVEIDVRELDQLLHNINNNNYDEQYIQTVRKKLLGTIEVLSSRPNLSDHYTQLLDKILRLNDSLLMLCNTEEVSAEGNVNTLTGVNTYEKTSNIESGTNNNKNKTSRSVLGKNVNTETSNNTNMVNRQLDNLMEFGDSSLSATANKDDFDFFNYGAFNTEGNSNSVSDVFSNSFDKSVAHKTTSGTIGGSSVSNLQNSNDSNLNNKVNFNTTSSTASKDDVKESLDDIFNFISLNTVDTKEDLNNKDDSDDDDQLFEDEDELINNFINSPTSFSYMEEGVGVKSQNQQTADIELVNDNNVKMETTVNNEPLESRSFTNEPVLSAVTKNELKSEASESNLKIDENKDQESSSNKKVEEKNLSQLVSELDNLEVDFGHMSVNNF